MYFLARDDEFNDENLIFNFFLKLIRIIIIFLNYRVHNLKKMKVFI